MIVGAAKTQAEFFAGQAQDAFRRGQDLMAAGDYREALRWIERARRFAPKDDTLRFSLGLVLLRLGEAAAAASVLEEVARSCDVGEAWFGLASARARLGQAEPAAAALHAMLSRHVLPDDEGVEVLADAVARDAGRAGWCGRRRDGGVTVSAAGPVVAVLDGRRLTRRRLAAPPAAGVLALSCGGRDLLGSPLDLAAFRRVEGFVAARDGGLEGWAWHPADPATPPRLFIRPAGGRPALEIIAEDTAIPAPRALARPRGFVVPEARLAGIMPEARLAGIMPAACLGTAGGLLHIVDAGGRDLTGSPVAPLS